MNKLPFHKIPERTHIHTHRERERVNAPSDLPILQKITATYKLWYGFLPQIPRLTRYSLGEKINLLFLELIELILLATYASKEQKTVIVNKASLKIDTLKYFTQLAWQLKILDNKRFAALSEPISEIGKMVGGWKKQLGKETPPV